MKTQIITDSEIADLKISSLPTRPTAPSAFGGRGYTASQMKAAFDKLPLFILERLNSLIEDMTAEPQSSVAASMLTGIDDGHTLYDMLKDIKNGDFSSYLNVLGTTLTSYVSALREELDIVKKDLGSSYSGNMDYFIDCGAPKDLIDDGKEGK